MLQGNTEGDSTSQIFCLDFCLAADQLDGMQHLLQVPPSEFNNSQSDSDISQDEVIEYGHQDNLELSALQEYLSMIDKEDSEGET